MNGKQSRRFVLKALSGSATVSTGYFTGVNISRGNKKNSTSHPSIDDLQVINNGKSGRELGVKFIPIGRGGRSKPDKRTQINKGFEVNPVSEERGPPIASGDVNLGEGEYKVVLTGPSGRLGSRTINLGPGGIPDYGSIIVSRTPDNSARISYFLY